MLQVCPSILHRCCDNKYLFGFVFTRIFININLKQGILIRHRHLQHSLLQTGSLLDVANLMTFEDDTNTEGDEVDETKCFRTVFSYK